MKKFFLFRKEEINLSTVTASDTGAGVSVFAVPADSLAFATASKGYVKLTFNDASIYEESNLTDGESMEKTTVVIPCEEGEEMALIQTILVYVSRDTGKPVMSFDAVEGSSIFDSAAASKEMASKIHVNPTKRLTGQPSTQSFIGSTGTVGADTIDTTIAGIDFGLTENKPIVDFNHEALESKTVGHEINSWSNAGTGGNTYDIGSNTGAPTVADSSLDISKRSAAVGDGDLFDIPTLTVSKDYTLYVVFTAEQPKPMYGDSEGECFGFSGELLLDPSTGIPSKIPNTFKGSFTVRHDGLTGAPAKSETDNTLNSTESLNFPDYDNSKEKLLVFVVRRDSNFNMYLYDREGRFVAFIPASTRKKPVSVYSGLTLASATAETDGRTDGDLKIDVLGSVKNIKINSFDGNIARFGVIAKDIGSSSCSKLATDLFELYS